MTRIRLTEACAWLITMACCTAAEEVFPLPDWKDRPNPLASPDAVVGGHLTAFAGQYPKSFNYYLDQNTFNALLFEHLYDRLLSINPLTADYEPSLAKEWSISDDKLTYTFWLDQEARWSDGKPITAEDIRWTYEVILDPKTRTGAHKVGLEKLHPPEVLDSHTIRFTAKELHWSHIGTIGRLNILPSHVFRDKEFNKLNFEFPVVSGPLKLGEIKEGILAKLHRRNDWWGWKRASSQNLYNFETLVFRFFAERENAFEAFKKGQIDVYPVYTSRLWVNETKGQKFDKNWIIKQKVQNYNPSGFQGFAMNMRRPLFGDKRVRKAMAHLIDREKMNRTLMYSQYFMQRSIWEDLYDEETPYKNIYYEFNPDKARRLLKKAGWSANPKTGILEKDGKPFRFKFLNRDSSANKFLAIYNEDLRDVGIELEIEKKDWAAWVKDMDEYNFEMTWASWSSGIFKDPESMWDSKEAERPSGQNVTGFKDSRVDKLIEEQRMLFDVQNRHAICREIDAIISDECPYALLWNINYVRLLYWNKFGMPDTVLSKFSDELAIYSLWWFDEDSDADLKDAMENGTHLPSRPPNVNFDSSFRSTCNSGKDTP